MIGEKFIIFYRIEKRSTEEGMGPIQLIDVEVVTRILPVSFHEH